MREVNLIEENGKELLLYNILNNNIDKVNIYYNDETKLDKKVKLSDLIIFFEEHEVNKFRTIKIFINSILYKNDYSNTHNIKRFSDLIILLEKKYEKEKNKKNILKIFISYIFCKDKSNFKIYYK